MKIQKSALLKKLRKTDSPRQVVALDIGTEFVKVLIANVDGDNLEIIGVGRAHQELADMQSGAIADIAGVVENCDRALTEAENMANADAKKVVIGIAGELVKGNTATIRFKRKNGSSPIALPEMENIVSRVQERAGENAKSQLAVEVGNQNVDVRLVNSALVGIDIDGYTVTNPVGFQGTDVAVQLYTAYAPMIHIGALERTADELDLDLLAVAAEPFAVARSVIGTDASSNFSAILIDVGGGTTDIAVVNDGGVEGTKMFGIGGRSFSRTIANELALDFEQAEKMKLSLSKTTKPSSNKSLQQAIDKTLKVWLSGVELALSEFDHLDNLPNRILLCGGGSSLPAITQILSESDWYKKLPFTRRPKVDHIVPKQVVDIVDKTGTIQDHTYITAMGLLRVGLDTASEVQEDENSVINKLNKILSI